LHDSSERRKQPFVAVNCAAIPESLIESELFGHLPGSFSGAGSRGKRGLIQEADGGTLFLDEIGDMPLPLQGRLLRVLAEREVLPVGATRPIAVNLRVVAATHCDLVAAVKAGRFRDDLYYRLNGAHFHLPPLRERQDLENLIERLCAAGSPPVRLSEAARERLLAHGWPGNLRELCNVLECARSLSADGTVQIDDLPESLTRPPPGHLAGLWHPAPSPPQASPAAGCSSPPLEPWLVALQRCRWNVSEAARQLGVSRMTLYRWMKRSGVRSPNHAQGSAL
jgi:transcriptional regulator of acetoin/glycerol metabolism